MTWLGKGNCMVYSLRLRYKNERSFNLWKNAINFAEHQDIEIELVKKQCSKYNFSQFIKSLQ
jgi:hypothetical protein